MKRRRGEGQTEYAIMIGLISICAFVSMFRFGGEVQRVLERTKVCISCGAEDETDARDAHEGETPEEKAKHEKEEAERKEREKEKDKDKDEDRVLEPWEDPDSIVYWFAQMIRWFGGAPHMWNWL